MVRLGMALGALVAGLFLTAPAMAQESGLAPDVERAIAEVTPRLIAWRRDIHQNPELGNRETRTARLVAAHLRSLRLDEVRTNVAHTGVVGILRGGRPGPVIALRADMDALPVTEEVDVPFASRVRTRFNGEEVGVMHACGHDTHTAILMAAADVLAARRANLPGTVMFIFQPAEEGAPVGERGGAELMLAEGLFRTIKPDAVYGLHTDNAPGGKVWATTGPVMASADEMRIIVRGRQTHAARPHLGVDPITVAAQIITALQLIPARQINAVDSPVVISVGRVRGGVRFNIIPDDVELWGTLRVLDPTVYEDVKNRIRRTAEQIAASAGATADVRFEGSAYPALVNNAAVAERGMTALRRALGAENVLQATPAMTAEDFSFFAREVPGFYFSYGVNAPGVEDAPSNHSPRFFVHEPTMVVGLRALLAVALDRLSGETAAASAVSD